MRVNLFLKENKSNKFLSKKKKSKCSNTLIKFMKHDIVISLINFHYLYLYIFTVSKHTHVLLHFLRIISFTLSNTIQLSAHVAYNSIWLSTESPDFHLFINIFIFFICFKYIDKR